MFKKFIAVAFGATFAISLTVSPGANRRTTRLE